MSNTQDRTPIIETIIKIFYSISTDINGFFFLLRTKVATNLKIIYLKKKRFMKYP